MDELLSSTRLEDFAASDMQVGSKPKIKMLGHYGDDDGEDDENASVKTEKKDPLELITDENMAQKSAVLISFLEKKVMQGEQVDQAARSKKLYTPEMKKELFKKIKDLNGVKDQIKPFAVGKQSNLSKLKTIVAEGYECAKAAAKHFALVKKLS